MLYSRKLKKLICLFILFFSTYCHAYDYELSICAIFCDDDLPYMSEWIDFHRKQGVEHFYLYNHGTKDAYISYWDHGLNSGIIEVIEWQYPYTKVYEWGHIQCRSYMHCIEKCSEKTKWLGVIDTDEFLFSPKFGNLKEALKYYDSYSGVVCNWIMYGTSNKNVPLNEMITNHLLYRSPINFWGNKTIKSIVKPKYVYDCPNPHCFLYSQGIAINENYEFISSYFSENISVNIFRINHYWCRDLNFFYMKKLPRRILWGDDYNRCVEMEKNILNQEFDDIIKYYN